MRRKPSPGWVFSTGLVLLFSGSPLVLAQEKAPPLRSPHSDEGRKKIFQSFYDQTQKSLIKKKFTQGSVKIEFMAAPDAHRFLLAEDYKRLTKAKRTGIYLWRELGSLNSRYKKLKGQSLLRFGISGGSNHFVMNSLGELIRLKSRSAKKITVLQVKPKLQFQTWKIFQSPTVHQRSLAPLKTLSVDVLIAWKGTKRESLQIWISGIVSQAQSRDRHDSINTRKRQISCKDFQSLVVPPITFQLEPARWILPELPDGFAEMLGKLGS